MRLFNRMDFYFIGQMQWPLVIDQMHLQGFYLYLMLFIVARECHQLVSQKKQQEVFFIE